MTPSQDSTERPEDCKERPYSIPANEKERLEALHALGILNSEPEAGFDRIAVMASRLFNAPIALVSLVAAEHQWFKAKCGLEVSETPRDFSFCTHTMLEPGPMVICDATRDVRFQGNPLVTGGIEIRFYVGAPILTRSGLALGSLCVIDKVPREFPPQNLLDNLMDLAFLVSEQIEFRAELAAVTLAEKQHQEQLLRARHAAEAANQAKIFLARMSHEIRTPMNLILGMNSLLLESPLSGKQRQHVEISHRNVRRLLRLVNGILDLSQVEAGDLIFQMVPFDLTETLNECAAAIASTIERNGLEFEITTDGDAWRYWVGDPERLQQVLLNLIGNSIKFTTKGRIAVRVSAEVGAAGEAGLRFVVSDTGCGVPKDKASIIFEAFQQAEEAMDRSYEGTGLGLSIAKTLVERMAGKIWLAEQTGPGATFIFTAFLGIATAEAVVSRSVTAGPVRIPAGLEGARVLLVEDNPENVILIEAYLEKLSLSLDFAVNGLEAVEKRQRNVYDLVLMDIQMPVMDGYTATRKIREWEQERKQARIPIVALTANAFKGAAADSMEAGCDGHLTKPVERHEVLETIAKYARVQVRGGEEGISEAILAHRPIFLAKRRADLEKMRDALAAGNFALIQSIGHNCKGTGAGYGFPKISQIGLAIQKAAKALDGQQVEESIGHFETFVMAATAEEALRVEQQKVGAN